MQSTQLCRFLVLVCGTLVYGKGDEHEQKTENEALIHEALVLGGDAPPSGSAPPPAAPILTRASAGGMRTAPMAMSTPSSFKVLTAAHVIACYRRTQSRSRRTSATCKMVCVTPTQSAADITAVR